MAKYRGFLTDIDDTLFATSDFLPIALKEAVHKLIEYGLPAEFDDAMARLESIRENNSNASDHFNRLCESYGKEYHIERIIRPAVDAYHNVKFSLLRPRAHVADVLNYLRDNGFRLGVVSSGRRDKQYEKLDRLNTLDFFVVRDKKAYFVVDDYIFISEDNNKTYLYREAIKKMSLDIKKTIVLDDRLEGIAAAHSAGIINTIKLKRGKYKGQTPCSILLKQGISPEALSNPDTKAEELIRAYTPKFEVGDWYDLIPLIRRLI
ncbi:MAG: HAD hydrolase-like protein [Nanoarchaeota archaeon]